MSTVPGSEPSAPRRRLVTQLWFLVLVGIVAGIVFGLVAPEPAKGARWPADAFIQLIKTITGPVIFVTVVIRIASLGNLARAGGLALRALGCFLVATVVALTLGLLAGSFVKPGDGLEGQATEQSRADAKESISEAGDGEGFVSFITEDLLPESFLGPFVDNSILQVLVLAIVTAASISALAATQRERVVAGFETASHHLRAHPHHQVGRPAGRLRRHGLHRRPVRQPVAHQPGHADGHLLGDVRDLRVRRAAAACCA